MSHLSRNLFPFLAATVLLIGASERQAAAGITFDLSFENTLLGAQGETPVTSSGVTFVPGAAGAAGYFPSGSVLTYASAGNINALVGTLEFFVTPDWNGNDWLNHNFFSWGTSGGMLFAKDGANNIRGIFNRFGPGATTEFQATNGPFNVSSWKAGETHYLVYTWDDTAKVLQFYLDGQLQRTNHYTGSLPAISAATFQVGGAGGTGNLRGALDELRISDQVLSADDISRRYADVTAAPEPASLTLILAATGCWLGYAALRRPPKNVHAEPDAESDPVSR